MKPIYDTISAVESDNCERQQLITPPAKPRLDDAENVTLVFAADS